MAVNLANTTLIDHENLIESRQAKEFSVRLSSSCVSLVLTLAGPVFAGNGNVLREGVSFDEYFTEGVLRVDVIHSGNRSNENDHPAAGRS
jgi:hypothetical protein